MENSNTGRGIMLRKLIDQAVRCGIQKKEIAQAAGVTHTTVCNHAKLTSTSAREGIFKDIRSAISHLYGERMEKMNVLGDLLEDSIHVGKLKTCHDDCATCDCFDYGICWAPSVRPVWMEVPNGD